METEQQPTTQEIIEKNDQKKNEPQDQITEEKIDSHEQDEKNEPQPQDQTIEVKNENIEKEIKNEPQKEDTRNKILKNSNEEEEKNDTRSYVSSPMEAETIIQLTIPTYSAHLNIAELNKNEDTNKESQQKKQKLGLLGRTKSWMENVWHSMKKANVKKLWAKAEYIEYKTATGEIRKIPKKKLNLKKNKANNTKSRQIPQDLRDGCYYGLHYHL